MRRRAAPPDRKPRPRSRERRLPAALGLLAALLAAAAGIPAQAQDKLPAAVAVVVDYQRILRDAKAARAIREQVEARRQLYQEQIAKEEQRLHEADKELARQRSLLTPEAFADKQQAFERQVAEVQRMVQERRRQLDQVGAVALNEVRTAMVGIIGRMSDAKGFNLVLPTSTVLLFSPRIDLTQEVLAQLDRELPTVKVQDRIE